MQDPSTMSKSHKIPIYKNKKIDERGSIWNWSERHNIQLQKMGHKIGWKCIKCREIKYIYKSIQKVSKFIQRPKLMNPFSLWKQTLLLVGLFHVHQVEQISFSSTKNQITKLQFSQFIYPNKYIQYNHKYIYFFDK